MRAIEQMKQYFSALPFQRVMCNKLTASLVAEMYKELAEKKVYEPSQTFFYTYIGKLEKYLIYYDVGEAVAVDEDGVFSSEASKNVHHSLMVLNGALAQDPNLTKEETVGFELLRQAMEFRYEHFDGTGGPGRFQEEQIPPVARLLAVAQVVAQNVLQLASLKDLFNKLDRQDGKELDPSMVALAKEIVTRRYEQQEAWLGRYRHIDAPAVELQYLPVYDVPKEKVFAYRGRLVLNDDKQGTIQPEVYLSVAEKNGRLPTLTLLGMTRLCERLAMSKFDQSVSALPVTVEVSPSCLRKKSFLAGLEKLFSDYLIDPAMVRFALSETVLAYEDKSMNEVFTRLKSMGIGLTLSNFGSEYANLAKLSEWDFDVIELSGALIDNVADNHKTYEIVKSIMQLAKTLETKVYAFGVNQAKQQERLAELGCRYMQGNCFNAW